MVQTERPTIEPFPHGTDFFTALGLPRKLTVDRQELERRYYDLSRRFHPDFYQTASVRERLVSLENSALLNKAYRTLRDPLTRAEYLVQLESDAGKEIQSQPPQALFEAILELNELLSDYRLAEPGERSTLQSRLLEKQREFQAEYETLQQRLTSELFTAWDHALEAGDAGEPERRSLLTEIGRLIGNRSYLRRVLSTLEEALCEEPT